MISIIVPVYKVERYLRQCLNSIINQTYRDIEILLIDDGSPDRCGEICEEYARKDTRIRVFHTDNKGLSAARNLGLREAKGEYIGFVDSDDWIELDMYEILLRQLEKTGTNISICGVFGEYIESTHEYRSCDGVYTGAEAIWQLLYCFRDSAWNKLYKKVYWTGIFFPESHTYEDIATIYKVVLKAYSESSISKPLYHYRMREGSIVYTQTMENLKDYWRAIYDRCIHLKTLPNFKQEQRLINILEQQVAFAAVKNWRWIFIIPREQRDYVFLRVVSRFVQKSFPLFGKKDWNICLRFGIFFPHYMSELSFALFYFFNFFFIFIKQRNKKPFPS